MKLAVIACYVATQIMQLTLARDGKDQIANVVFSEQECQLLQSLQKKLEGRTALQKNPHSPMLLSWAAWIIGRLGGWKGYKSESPPGPITMFRGLNKFRNIYRGWMLAKDVCID